MYTPAMNITPEGLTVQLFEHELRTGKSPLIPLVKTQEIPMTYPFVPLHYKSPVIVPVVIIDSPSAIVSHGFQISHLTGDPLIAVAVGGFITMKSPDFNP